MQEQYWIPAANLSWRLVGSDFNFAVAEQVIVPSDTVTFPAGEVSTTTTVVVSFAEPVQLAGRNASFRIAFRVRAEVLCGKNTMIPKGVKNGHNDCLNAGSDKMRAYIKGSLGSNGLPVGTRCTHTDSKGHHGDFTVVGFCEGVWKSQRLDQRVWTVTQDVTQKQA